MGMFSVREFGSTAIESRLEVALKKAREDGFAIGEAVWVGDVMKKISL